MAVTAGLPFVPFAMIRVCQVTLVVLNHSEDRLAWADLGAIVAAHRSLLYSISISDALNYMASYLFFSMLLEEPYNQYFCLMFSLGFSLIASQYILLYAPHLIHNDPQHFPPHLPLDTQ